jgi:hypothetical protein
MKYGWDMLIPEDERDDGEPSRHVWKQRDKAVKGPSDLIPVPIEAPK